MPTVEVQLFAALRQFIGGKRSQAVEITAGETVAQVLARLGVPAEKTRLVFINNRAASLDLPLAGGEVVSVFPVIGGG
jgi:molybdopterin converting factor small subunit